MQLIIKITNKDRKNILKFLFAKPRLNIFILWRLLYIAIIFLLKNPDITRILKKEDKKDEIVIQDEDDKIKIYLQDTEIIFYKSAKNNIVNFVNRETGDIILNLLKIFQKEVQDERIKIEPFAFPFNIFFELNISEVAEKLLPFFRGEGGI